jgi:hypothetical protein
VNEIVTIARFRDLPQAELACGKLEAEGIPAFLADHNLVGLSWIYSNAVGGIRLQVMREHMAEARMILNTDYSSALTNTDAAATAVDRDISCSECGSTRVRQSKLRRKSAAVSILLNLPILFWGTRLTCDQCGHCWRPGQSYKPFPDIPAAVDSDELKYSSGVNAERSWRDDVARVVLILMCLLALAMLYDYAN